MSQLVLKHPDLKHEDLKFNTVEVHAGEPRDIVLWLKRKYSTAWHCSTPSQPMHRCMWEMYWRLIFWVQM